MPPNQNREFDLDYIFSYHAPDGDQIYHYNRLRTAAKAFAEILLQCTPPSADQSDAIRKLRECVMTANASIALNGRLYKFNEETPVTNIAPDIDCLPNSR